MKTSILLPQLLLSTGTVRAFSPGLLQRSVLTRQSQPLTKVFSQWDEEEEESAADPQSFSAAQVAMSDEDEENEVAEMGDYDQNPDYNQDDIDRVRAAIRERTEALGIEKSQVSAEAIKAAEERARLAIENRMSGASQLDLSQISTDAPRGEAGEEVPAMFFEPEDEMTEEEMIEADPDGQLSFPDQVMKEIRASTWPTPGAILREMFILFAVGASTCALIVNWDNFLRDTYTNFGLIPRSDEIMQASEDMVLPEGWTNGMSEDDFMNFREEVGKDSPSVAQLKEEYPEL